MKKIRILWADDEIDLLKPHILFLEAKGYEVVTATNGMDAIELVQEEFFDIIFLDEMMPGLTGLETLAQIKEIEPNVPVVMITRSEEENIMDEAIGSKMADYLIKPVNPNQILLTIKKNVDRNRLVTEKTTSAYQSQFSEIGMKINERLDFDEWTELYRKLVFWELELSSSEQGTMDEILSMQKNEANNAFCRYISKNYLGWFGKEVGERPLLSPDLFRHRIFPELDEGEKVFVLVIDNLRYDQWRVLSPLFSDYYLVEEEELFCSILPTATMYARNAMFAGLMPSEIKKIYPEYWLDEGAEGTKNQYEEELLRKQLARFGRKESLYFDKIQNLRTGKKATESLNGILQNDLSVMVVNFIDMLSHARTEMEMIKELAADEAAYRSLTVSWFRHSSVMELLRELSAHDVKVIITTDHGSIRVQNPLKVIGDRNVNTNLRYKHGKNLNYNPKEVFQLTKPATGYLPATNVSTTFIFARNQDFFLYPNNYNHHLHYYKNTFQHGGISLEEMLIPFVTLVPKG